MIGGESYNFVMGQMQSSVRDRQPSFSIDEKLLRAVVKFTIKASDHRALQEASRLL